jgi:23S rRNA pseudouridine2605 synthase
MQRPGWIVEQENQRKSGQRIAKVIARAGLASRREAEAWIAAGRVAVNGAVIASAALDVTGSDRITIDGEPLPVRQRTRLFLYHKSRGLLTTHADPRGRPTIFQNLPRDLPRLISVGRLDFNTEGLLLLTNDGTLARLLELPSTGWLRRYRVRAHGTITQDKLDGLRRGVTISGIHYGPIEATLDRVQASNVWLTLGIREGKNREVRNVLGHLGLAVTRLIRISFGPFQLGELREGEIEEVRTRVLRDQLGDKLIRLSGVDFSAPRATPPRTRSEDEARPIAQQTLQGKSKNRGSSDHAWRAHEQGAPTKKLRRKFHGSRRNVNADQPPQGKAQAGLVTDRRGRAVAVEHYPKKTPIDPPQQRDPGSNRKKDRRRQRSRNNQSFNRRPRRPGHES